jgi:4-amino-4-deoxy-L-arabinose transferase-like glycosyltransferase
MRNILNLIILYGIVFVIAVVIYNIQRLSPFFHFVTGKNNTFILTFSEFLHNPFQVFFQNVINIPYYTAQNLGFATFIFGLIGLGIYTKKNKLMGLYFIIWIVAPYIAISFFNKVLFSRYIIFLLIPFIIFTAYLIDYAWKKYKNKVVIVLILIITYSFAFYFNYTIIFDQKNIPLVPSDRGQYLEAWPAGWGAKEIVEYARDKSATKPVVLLAEGTFGMSGDVLDTFIKPNDKISIRGFWPLGLKELVDAQKDLDTNTILVVFSHTSQFAPGWPIKLIHAYEKPGNNAAIYLFELTK